MFIYFLSLLLFQMSALASMAHPEGAPVNGKDEARVERLSEAALAEIEHKQRMDAERRKLNRIKNLNLVRSGIYHDAHLDPELEEDIAISESKKIPIEMPKHIKKMIVPSFWSSNPEPEFEFGSSAKYIREKYIDPYTKKTLKDAIVEAHENRKAFILTLEISHAEGKPKQKLVRFYQEGSNEGQTNSNIKDGVFYFRLDPIKEKFVFIPEGTPLA